MAVMGEQTDDAEIIERLDEHELRYTTGRRTIVRGLRAATGPVTLPELLALVPELPQSSAYRNLALLEEAGVVRRLVHGNDHARYELSESLTEHHHHLICEECGTVRDITFAADLEQTIDRRFEQLATAEGFTLRDHSIDLYGRCPACA